MRLKNLLSFNNTTALVKISFLIFLFLIMLFNRSFVGLYIFGFRLGELLTGVGLLFAMIFLLAPKKYLSDFYFNNLQFYSQKLIFISFFVVTFLNEGSLFNAYTYKSSSYIWTIAFLFFGVINFNNLFEIFLNGALNGKVFKIFIPNGRETQIPCRDELSAPLRGPDGWSGREIWVSWPLGTNILNTFMLRAPFRDISNKLSKF